MSFQLSLNELISLATIVFLAGGLWWQTRQMNGRFDKLDKRDEAHDTKLADHNVRLTKVETTVEHQGGWMREMRDQLREIYTTVVGNKS